MLDQLAGVLAGQLGTLRDASTPVCAQLAETSPVQIRPPRLGEGRLPKRAFGIRLALEIGKTARGTARGTKRAAPV